MELVTNNNSLPVGSNRHTVAGLWTNRQLLTKRCDVYCHVLQPGVASCVLVEA